MSSRADGVSNTELRTVEGVYLWQNEYSIEPSFEYIRGPCDSVVDARLPIEVGEFY
jgi:hypothetical protein